jgi:hypothetical protein
MLTFWIHASFAKEDTFAAPNVRYPIQRHQHREILTYQYQTDLQRASVDRCSS